MSECRRGLRLITLVTDTYEIIKRIGSPDSLDFMFPRLEEMSLCRRIVG